MAIDSAADLLAALRQHQLLKPGQLEELARQLKGKKLDARGLAQKLIQQRWLTPYQANQLLRGGGQELALGSYIIQERLGEGGMGQVFKARHKGLDRLCALKMIRKERLGNPDAVKRFHREVRAAAQLSHPNIVMAFDADQIGDTHLLVTEYVDGADLNQLVKKNGPLPVEQACQYIRQAALGLQKAHECGMIHRDIKPHNLLLSRQGTVKILDMGLARFVGPEEEDSASTLTKDGSVLGTPDYISPEQAKGAHGVDIRSDLYSLGCTFYFLLTGQVPFPGGTLGAKLVQHQLDEPAPVEKLRPEVPPGVAAVVRKLLAKKPEQRYQTPAELAAALAGGAATSAASWNRRRLWPAAAAVVLVLGLGLLALLLQGGDTATDPTGTVEAGGVIENDLGMKLRLIPAGRFLMGSSDEEIERVIALKLPWTPEEIICGEGPRHEVEISQPFYMGVHPVTRGQFRQFILQSGHQIPKGASRHQFTGSWAVDANASWHDAGYSQDDRYPVTCVNWSDATAFIKWLNNRHALTPPGAPKAWRYALPTEAQWEYACRAGTTTRYSCGDSDASLQGFANLADVSFTTRYRSTDWGRAAVAWDDGYVFTAPAGTFKPNPWGLHDMHGNVWQWCADAYEASYYQDSPRRDPPGPFKNGQYVLRGGSWTNTAAQCRSAARYYNGSNLRRDHYGFRVVLVRP